MNRIHHYFEHLFLTLKSIIMNVTKIAIAHSYISGNNILWGAASDGKLYFRIQKYGSLDWGAWQEETDGQVPANVVDLAVCGQNWESLGENRLQLWALDNENVLYGKYQNNDGNWTPWVKNWNGAPAFTRITACEQSGDRGAQFWGVDTTGVLRSTYQHSPGHYWSGWSGSWENAPINFIDLTACLNFYNYDGSNRKDGLVQLWALTKDKTMHSIYQTSAGGNWSNWLNGWQISGLEVLTSTNQGYLNIFNVFGGTKKVKGAQIWGATGDKLASRKEEKAGHDWSNWELPWHSPLPGNPVITDISAGGLNSLEESQSTLYSPMIAVVTEKGQLFFSYVNKPGSWSNWIQLD